MPPESDKKQLRILHCPTTVGNNPQSLARAERELGLNSWSMAFRDDYFSYETDEFLINKDENVSNAELEIRRWKFLLKAIKNYDIFHFNFGTTLFPEALENTSQNDFSLKRSIYNLYGNFFESKDLRLLRYLKKGICVTYQGSDARQGDFCRENFEITYANHAGECFPPKSDEIKRRKIDAFSTYAHRIYSLNPDLLHVLPSNAQFMPYATVDIRKWEFIDKPISQSDVPIVVHAPTNRKIKGTDLIVEAVEKIKQQGIELEFIMVENMSNAEAHKLYEKADLLIDQLYAGWYGGLAVELMSLGKPVIAYIRQEDLKFIPGAMKDELPVIDAKPNNIYEVLKNWVTVRKTELPELGKKSRAFVEKWHNPMKIASDLKRDYEEIQKNLNSN